MCETEIHFLRLLALYVCDVCARSHLHMQAWKSIVCLHASK